MTKIFQFPQQLTKAMTIDALVKQNASLMASLASVKSVMFFLTTYLRDNGELRRPKTPEAAPLQPTDAMELIEDVATEEWVLRFKTTKPEEKPLVALPEGPIR